ncbi:MAG: glutathione S-transferase family protein [Pseudomonadota bacterium]
MAGYVLYGYPQSGSAAVELALVEAAIPFEMQDLDPEAGDLESADFLAINPRGQVPALRHPDGSVITEVPAILLHLADAHPECGLAPPPGGSARAQHDRWLSFVHANCYEAVLRYFYTERYTTDPSIVEPVREAALAYIIRHFNLLAEAIETGPFLFGETPMAVDFLIWAITTWLVEEDITAYDVRITHLAEALAARPNLATAVARNTA